MTANLETLTRRQAALADFGAYAFQENDLRNILNEAARICAKSFGVAYCKICKYRPTENDLLIEAGFGWGDDVVGQVVSKADQTSPQGRAFVTGKAVILQNLAEEENTLVLADFYSTYRIVSTVDVLITTRTGKPFGVLEIDSTVLQGYNQYDIDFLTGFANVLAEAVATNSRNQLLQQTIASMKTLIGEKEQLLIDRNCLLEERNLLAKELHHRVRNNLSRVNAMLEREIRENRFGSGQDGLRGVMRQVTILAEVHDQLLGVGLSNRLDFGDYLKSLCLRLQNLQATPLTYPVELLCDAEEELFLDVATVTALGVVVAELVANAYEHAFTEHGGTIEARVGRDGSPNLGVVTVHDDGTGYVAPLETKRNGIALAHRFMATIGGTLDVTGDAGTTWTLRFPIGDRTNKVLN